jgi:hypothetical protein
MTICSLPALRYNMLIFEAQEVLTGIGLQFRESEVLQLSIISRDAEVSLEVYPRSHLWNAYHTSLYTLMAAYQLMGDSIMYAKTILLLEALSSKKLQITLKNWNQLSS